MSTREVITLTCDMCESGDLVETHKMIVDGAAIEFETCERCWGEFVENFARIAAVGRKAPKPKRVSRKATTYDFPGEAWRFTAHALQRLGERHITPHSACLAADNPDITRPGNSAETMIRQRNGVKVVVDDERRLILTVSSTDEDVDAVA